MASLQRVTTFSLWALSSLLAAAGVMAGGPEPFPNISMGPPLANDTTEHLVGGRELLAGAKGSGWWNTRGNNFIDAAGSVVYFSGVIWSGFETPEAVVHGLWGRSYQDHLDQMKRLGFNALRLPFAGETLLPSTYPKGVDYNANPDLKGLKSLQAMDKVIAACAARGIKVILDYHRKRLTVANEDGLWYDDQYPESVWINNWVMLAKRYRYTKTIIGADLFNEVHPCEGCPPGAPYWARPSPNIPEKYNFRSATLRVARAIQAVQPNWLIFLEGMHNNYWWGGNCMEMLKAPINLPVKRKIAYSPHEYGPYVYPQPWFKVPNFPNNLPALFSRRWGLISERGLAPIWVGEFGSFYPQGNGPLDKTERLAFTTLIAYMRKLKSSWTLAFWGPDSKDTGGVLTNDWRTPDQTKLQLLSSIMHPNFGPSPGQT